MPLYFDFRCWFIHRPRDVLYSRIDERCEQMVANGLVEEVQKLLEAGIEDNTSASQAIGYRQTLEFLKTKQSPDDYQTFIQKFQRDSRRYAKRQFTWFRKEPLFRWIDIELHDPETAVDMILKDYGSLA